MATSNQIKLMLNMVRYWSRKSSTKGFTLPELLMAMVVASIVVYAMLSLVISLLETDQKETAKSQIQTEMTQAMDYIARDLEQAVYIYPGNCLGTSEVTDICKGLGSQINFTAAGVTPVLAFWKLEQVPDEELPDDCNSVPPDQQQECIALLTGRHTYTLVVYSYQDVGNNHETWDGPIVINRFQLRRYTNTSTLEQTLGYSDPGANFGEWESSAVILMDNNPVLVDSVDQNDANSKEPCPAGYTESENTISSFYACVKNPSASGQDAIIYLRGNAAKRAGQPNSRNPVYLPTIKRQVKARSVLNYTPLKLE